MEFIEVAKIINSHGIKGSVKVFLLTNSVDRFNSGCAFYIDKRISVTVKSVRSLSQDTAILTFNEYDNINDILKFKNLSIFVNEDDLIDLPEDEFYVYKLIGMKVYNQENIFVGEISNVLTTLANDVYEIHNGENVVYIPAVKEFVIDVDTDNAVMKVNTIDGMLND